MKITPLLKIWLALATGIMVMQPAALAAATRVAVIPFQINADKDYTFLQKGIVDMLSSRLSSPTVEVIDPLSTAKALEEVKAFKGESMVLMAAAKLKADFAIHGSITILGGSVSIDAKMLDVTGTRTPLSFFKQTQGMDAVIPQINQLATEINTSVFGRSGPVAAVGPQTAPQTAPQTGTQPEAGQDIHMHPEKLLRNGVAISEGPAGTDDDQLQGAASPLNPAFITPSGQSGSRGAFWKTRNLPYLINGLAVGDINGDGLLETVVLGPQDVYIYQFVNKRMQLIKKMNTGRYVYNIGVDIGDINHNGIPEIFISSLNNQRNRSNSLVLEFSGADLKTIVSDSRWVFRIIDHQAFGKLLMGQRHLSGGAPNASEIVELQWQGGEYRSTRKLLPANKASLLGLAIGDIFNDKSENAVAYTPEDHLRVMGLNGNSEWTSEDYYGGSTNYCLLPANDPGTQGIKVYLPVRILVTDIEGDGRYEVLTVSNKEASGRRLSQQRFYGKGQLIAMSWNGLGLTTAWQTPQISGRLQDLAVADFDNDGQTEILCAVISKEGAVIGTEPKSSLIAYDIAKPEAQ